MRVVLSWLRELCPTDLTAEELAERLTAQGVKVEAVLRPWERLSGVLTARVLEVADHPDSDRLWLARVTAGEQERTVVAGVRNMVPGDLVPYAPPGATLPDLAEPLRVRELRGQRSDGMLCSARELGISGDHGGILVLPSDTPLGTDVRRTFGLDDEVLDIEVKSNRPDLLSVVGVAREASAASGAPFVPPDTALGEAGEKAEDVATVEIRELGRCPRYLARVIRGVTAAPSPLRFQARLTASGMRPLSNVVDATNYVMLEMGQPMHPFDLNLLAGPGIVVRRAARGERLVTLDGVERVLSEEDLVIADLERTVAIAGVMGSAAAEVSASTAEVLLESAHFSPPGILRTSRRLGLATEASTRFGRGADPEAVAPAAARAAGLIAEWGGGAVLAGEVDSGGGTGRRAVVMRPARASLVLAYEVAPDQALEALGRLGIPATAAEGELRAEIPSARWDLRIEEDLIEEVARVLGYDRVPEALPPVRQAGGIPATYAFRRRVRGALVRGGLREAISYSFASVADLDLMGARAEEAVKVGNPLGAYQEFLRTSLLPGLLHALRTNLSRSVRGAALFEVGRVFRAGDPVEERESVAAALAGPAVAGYPDPHREAGFFDAKGALEALMEAVRAPVWELGGQAGPPFHPARSAAVHPAGGGEPVGRVGELHPAIRDRLDLPPGTAAFELDLARLEPEAPGDAGYREIPRFPPVRRDLAFVVPVDVPAGAVRGALVSAGGDLVDAAILFDVFEGPPVPPGKKSLAFSVDFRAPGRTLTDQEAESAVRSIVGALETRFGAELRAG